MARRGRTEGPAGDPHRWAAAACLFALAVLAAPVSGIDGHPGDSEPATGGPTEPRIQPGVAIVTPYAACTGGFLFHDTTGAMYMATAGHCFGGPARCETEPGTPVHMDGVGIFGTKALCYDRGVGSDLALIRIDAALADLAAASMLAWGGPTSDDGPAFGVVRHYGHGLVYDQAEPTRARTGAGTFADDTSFRMMGLVVNGDSGSPVRADDGHAIGIITHANGNAGILTHSAPYASGTTVARILDVAAAEGLHLALVTAPLADA